MTDGIPFIHADDKIGVSGMQPKGPICLAIPVNCLSIRWNRLTGGREAQASCTASGSASRSTRGKVSIWEILAKVVRMRPTLEEMAAMSKCLAKPYFPNRKMADILKRAYAPCPNFGSCPEAKWQPEKGHVPRGFLGCTGELEEVEAVLVLAEPGHPLPGERFSGPGDDDYIAEVTKNSAANLKHGATKLHENLAWVMDELWPSTSFEYKLRKVWITESRLCSVEDEIREAKGGDKKLCAREYLLPQTNILPNATVVLFGGKAQTRVGNYFPEAINAVALAPPGCNISNARPSWEKAIGVIKEKRRDSLVSSIGDNLASGIREELIPAIIIGEAQFQLAQAYEKGLHVERDYELAIRLYEKAANVGHIGACYSLGCIYIDGTAGMDRNVKEAAGWFLAGADRGHKDCQITLADILCDDDGYMDEQGNEDRQDFPKDLGQATYWYREAVVKHSSAYAAAKLINLHNSGDIKVSDDDVDLINSTATEPNERGSDYVILDGDGLKPQIEKSKD